MKRTIIVFLIVAAVLTSVSADISAKITEIAGKVEYSLPGKSWMPAKIGDVLPKGTIISTGFKSTAVLSVGASTITVKPVTRLSLEELLESASGSQTQLFLLAGRVKADVTPQEGKITEFQVKSPTATASVRGTGFEFDGLNLLVDRGLVQLQNPTGMRRSVAAGEFSYVAPNGSVLAPVAVSGQSGLERIDELFEQAEAENTQAIDKKDISVSTSIVIKLE